MERSFMKPCLIILVLSMVIVKAYASILDERTWGVVRARRSVCRGSVGDCIGEENEMMLDSEAGRRQLAGRGGYISYGALRPNNVPCGRRGNSYYNCQNRQRANPYRRGCNAITRCARRTG